LDYRHRNADGSAGKMPDSLRTAFKTHNGRTVFDGGGVRPDLEVDEFSGQPLLKLMMDERLLFDFANHYRNSHETIAEARSFKLSEADYNDFIKQTSENLVKVVLEKVKLSLNKSIPDTTLVNEILGEAHFAEKLKTEVTNKLTGFENALKYRLTQEILKRYYFDNALYESSFSGDPDIFTALGILKNEEKYRKTLNP
jgi:carboxyl-terminal processing protease